MKRFVLKKYRDRFWQVADLEIYEDEICKEVVSINKFYDVDSSWFTIYETEGGSGIGFKKGEIKRKIHIGDAEYKTEIQ